ncbi:hypothetical protein EVAR_87927_1 [Eumeta japonica]|uniref:Uncharacterized protein n=1 Tax=Eumeta variegata TaxID=151549 RepID=A0A4C1WW37_EUMVA|nr:hypothetical protein EVAR_87927_1 [Eumeta japonica]
MPLGRPAADRKAGPDAPNFRRDDWSSGSLDAYRIADQIKRGRTVHKRRFSPAAGGRESSSATFNERARFPGAAHSDPRRPRAAPRPNNRPSYGPARKKERLP